MAGTSAAQRGFSLVEMLVAVALFALIGIAGISLVQSILTTQRRTDDRLARLGQVQRAIYLVGFDLQQAAPTSLVLTNGALSFSRRAGDALTISITYTMKQGVLVRTIGTVRDQPLLSGVTALAWQFHFAGLGWRDQVRDERRWPDAIELRLASEPEGALRRVVDLTSPP
jgi:general secretion pathway protein J